MADPPNFSLFQQIFLTGDKPILTLDDDFLKNHTKLLLRSDASDRIWEVKLDGDRLAGGWEEFAAVHKFRDGDVLIFRHDADENFHVSVSSRSNSGDIQHESPSCIVTDIDDDGEDEDNGSEIDEGNISVKKNKKADSSSSHTCILRARVTPCSLRTDRLDLCRDFSVVSFGELKKPPEIDLVNDKGRTWTLLLAKNSSSGVFYIRRGWVNFCFANKLSQGDLCKFKLVENGERPVLWLCGQESGNGHEEDEECPEAYEVNVRNCSKEKRTLDEVSMEKDKKTHSPFLNIKLTSNRCKTGQLSISSVFAAENGIKEPGEITLLDQDGRKWPSYLHKTGQCRREWFYIRRGWKDMCRANGVEHNDSFGLELIWEDANPMFKFFSKANPPTQLCIENNGKVNRRTSKKRLACETPLHVEKTQVAEIEGQRVSRRGRAEHRDDEKRGQTQVLNRATTNSRKLRSKQTESCSVSDQVANVKRCIQDTLNSVRQFGAELETKEKNLEASLLEIDALGERILGISKILNNDLV